MIDAIVKLFSGTPDPDTGEAVDERIALAALLVDAARQDDDYSDAERAAIDHILAREHDVDAGAAATLREQAEAVQADAAGLFRFTHALKESTPFEDRVNIIEHLWEVVLSDGERDHGEDNMVRRVCGLIGVPDRDSGLARQRVEARLQG